MSLLPTVRSRSKQGINWFWSIRDEHFGWGDKKGAAIDLAGVAEGLRGMMKAGVDPKSIRFRQSVKMIKNVLMMSPEESSIKKEYLESVREQAWMILFLLELGERRGSQLMKKVIGETEEYRRGAFWRERTDDGNIFDTALMARCLTANRSAKQVELRRTTEWLKSNQNADGGWGFQPRTGSNNICTLMTSIALLESGEKPSSPSIKRAKAWILKHRDRTGGWTTTVEELPHVRGGTWNHFTKPHGVIFLLKARMAPSSKDVQAAVKSLCDNQDKSGGWRISPGSPIYTHATGHALSALGEYTMAVTR
jgi:hypothetical protein